MGEERINAIIDIHAEILSIDEKQILSLNNTGDKEKVEEILSELKFTGVNEFLKIVQTEKDNPYLRIHQIFVYGSFWKSILIYMYAQKKYNRKNVKNISVEQWLGEEKEAIADAIKLIRESIKPQNKNEHSISRIKEDAHLYWEAADQICSKEMSFEELRSILSQLNM